VNHADVKHHLADYLEGDLPLDERARLDAHLDGCPECVQEINEMLQTIRLLHLLPEPEMPPMLAANIMRRIRAGEAEPGWLERTRRAVSSIFEPSFVLPASAIAVAALVVMVVQEPDFVSRLFIPGSIPGSIGGPGAVDGRGEEFLERGAAESRVAARRFESAPAGLDRDVELARAFGASDLRQPPQSAEPRPSISIRIPSATTSSRLFGLTDSQFFEVAGSRPPGVTDIQGAQSGNAAALAANPGAVRYRFGSNASAARGSKLSNPDFGVVVSRSSQTRAQDRPRALAIAADKIGGQLGGNSNVNGSRARRVAQPRRVELSALSTESSGGEDARDVWLVRGFEDPVGFARFIAGKNLAEQELWVSRLAQRAESRGLLDDLVRVLRMSGDVSAAVLSDDFAAQVDVIDEDGPDWNAPIER